MSALAAPKRDGFTLALESSAVRPASSKSRATAAFSSERLLARAASFSARSLVRVFKSSSFSPRSFLVLSSSALRVSSSFMEVSSSSGLFPEKASTLRSSFLMRAQSRAARGSIFSMRGRMVSLLRGPSLPSSNLRWLMMSLRLVMPQCSSGVVSAPSAMRTDCWYVLEAPSRGSARCLRKKRAGRSHPSCLGPVGSFSDKCIINHTGAVCKAPIAFHLVCCNIF